MSADGLRIIVVKDKHSTSYLDASTPLAWAASALKLLSERYEQRWYASPDEIYGPAEPPYTPEQIEALKLLPEGDPARKAAAQQISYYKQEHRQRLQYEQWFAQMLRVIEEQDLSFVPLREDIDPARVPRVARPLAWQLLYDRGDYEYEYVALEYVSSPIDA